MGLTVGALNIHVPRLDANTATPQEHPHSINDFVRQYTVSKLREDCFHRLADSLTEDSAGAGRSRSAAAYGVLFKRCFSLAEEKREEFGDICSQLNIDGDLRQTYHQVVVLIFSDTVNLGRILTFAAFSAELVVHCARRGREDRATEVAGWGADVVTQRKLDDWIRDQGGWNSVARQTSGEQTVIHARTIAAIATTVLAVASVIATSVFIFRNSF